MSLYQYAAYPPELPNFEGGTGVAAENNLYQSPPTLGRPTQRSPRDLHPYIITPKWKLDRAQYLRFRGWWRDTLLLGVLPFTGNFCLNGQEGEYQLQFISNPSVQSEKGGFWVVTAKVWCWKLPEMSKEEALSQVIDVAFLQSLTDGLEGILDSYYDLGVQV